MKRIQYACLDQTIHFQLKEEIAHDLAVAEVQAEYENYKSALDRKHVSTKLQRNCHRKTVPSSFESRSSITVMMSEIILTKVGL